MMNKFEVRSASALLALALCVSFIGCAGKGSYNRATGIYDANAPADVVVVIAEKTRGTAVNVFDSLMTFEKHNKEALQKVNPKIHQFTELVRRESQKWLNDLTAARDAYQRERTPENASRLKAAAALLDSMLDSASEHLAKSIKAKEAP